MSKRTSSISTPAKRSRKFGTKKKPFKYSNASFAPLVRAPASVSFGRQPFPKQLKNTLTYCETTTISCVVGFGRFVISANGMYDVNISGTGHQPMYFDQCMALYDHYTVLRSRCKVQLCNNFTKDLTYALILEDDTAGSSTVDELRERGAMTQYCGGNASSPPPVFCTYSAVQVFGPNPQGNPSLNGTSSANPTEVATYQFVLNDVASGTFNYTIQYAVEFDVVWDELATPTGS